MKCEFCGSMYEKFAPLYPSRKDENALSTYNVIAGYGENVFCPHCLSTSRERLVLLILKNRFDLKDNTVLHFSPEKNIHGYLVKNAKSVVTADIYPGYYKTVDSVIQKMDLTNLLAANESFDLVIANHVMEHIPDDTKALSEIFRILKPNGKAILQVPYSTSLEKTIEIGRAHV